MKICQLELLCNDIWATKAFYTETLGLEAIAEHPGMLTIRVGWSELTFRQTDSTLAPYHFAFNIAAGCLDTLVDTIRLPYLFTAGGRRIAAFTDWQARACYFRDAEGNLVEFIERREAPFGNPPGQPFQGISEIGLAVDDVPAMTQHLITTYGLTQFSKSRPLPDFNAVGDDYGLFILAKKNRKWLFTDIPAATQPCKVLFSDCFNLPHLLLFEESPGILHTR